MNKILKFFTRLLSVALIMSCCALTPVSAQLQLTNSSQTRLCYDFLSFQGKMFVGTSSGIYKFSSSTQQWDLIYNINTISLTTDTLGNVYASTESGIITSSNGGINWTTISTPSSVRYGAPFVVSPNGMIMTEGGYGLIYSFDKGITWKKYKLVNDKQHFTWGVVSLKLLSNGTILGSYITMINAKRNYILNISFDKFNRISVRKLPLPNLVQGLDWRVTQLSNGTLYAAQYLIKGKKIPFVVYKSTTNGKRWTQVPTAFTPPMEALLMDLTADTHGNLFLGEESVGIFLSPDGGIHWLQFRADIYQLSGVMKLYFAPNGDLFVGLVNGLYQFPASTVNEAIANARQEVSAQCKNTFNSENREIPSTLSLSQNYPNPFNPSTTISYSLPVDGIVSLKIYNTLGQEVATLVNETQDAGVKSITWDATNQPSGIYYYKLQAGDFSDTKKLLLMK